MAYGPRVAARLPRRAPLAAAWGAVMAWTWSLALIDGWQRGIAVRLTTRYEYLQVIDRFQDIPATLRDFTHHILLHAPDHWPPHVAGHPPAATLTFVLLDRVGLGGPRRTRALPHALAGVMIVPLVFPLAGFNWWEAYHLLVERYYQGAGGIRPYGYWGGPTSPAPS